MTSKRKRLRPGKGTSSNTQLARAPKICDYDCPFADFPPAETAGICRTMSAVWCKQLKELVHKNTLCEWRRREASRGR